MRTPVLATVDETGAPSARVVVLRAWAPEIAALEVHTDGRSAKVADVAREPRAALTFWDPGRRVQLRAAGRIETIDAGPEWRTAWERTPPEARRTYAVSPAPGASIDGPLDYALGDETVGAAAFRVLRLKLAQLDFLALAPDGHRRARFEFRDGQTEGAWLAP